MPPGFADGREFHADAAKIHDLHDAHAAGDHAARERFGARIKAIREAAGAAPKDEHWSALKAHIIDHFAGRAIPSDILTVFAEGREKLLPPGVA